MTFKSLNGFKTTICLSLFVHFVIKELPDNWHTFSVQNVFNSFCFYVGTQNISRDADTGFAMNTLAMKAEVDYM